MSKFHIYLITERGVINHCVSSEWSFYNPKCYLEFSSAKYGSTSLKLAVLTMTKSQNPIPSGLKYLYIKLFCGITIPKLPTEIIKNCSPILDFQLKMGWMTLRQEMKQQFTALIVILLW